MSTKKKKVEDFEFGDVLGEGAFGAVVLGTDKETGKQYAVKMLDKKHIEKQGKIQYVHTERDILAKCKHPNIIKLFSTFQDKTNLYYVLELAPNGELLSYIRKHKTLSLSCVPFYSAELVLAVEYLHSQGIVHRDLKPENLLLDENMHLKLTDFGTAKMIGTEKRARSESFVGTAEYISPELLEQKVASRESDIWAIGCIIYQMICGRPAFRGATEYMTFQKVRQGNVSYPEGFPAAARDLIAKILVLNPEERYTIVQIKANRFFNLIDWDRIQQMKAPAFRPLSAKLTFPEDVLREEEERRRLLHEKLVKTWGGFLKNGETIVKLGYIFKRRKLSIKKRMMILTSTPRLIYIDAKKMEEKGAIPIDGDFDIIIKNDTAFTIYIPRTKRNFILEDIERDSSSVDWKEKILKACGREDN